MFVITENIMKCPV